MPTGKLMEVFPHPLFFSVALLFAIASGCGLIGCYWQNSVFLSALASLWHDQNTLASADQLLDFSSVRDRSLMSLQPWCCHFFCGKLLVTVFYIIGPALFSFYSIIQMFWVSDSCFFSVFVLFFEAGPQRGPMSITWTLASLTIECL